MPKFAVVRLSKWPLLGLLAAATFLPALSLADDLPLHERIDRLLETAAVGPVPSPAGDAEFLRRVSLDLTGVIPTAAEARAFLTDTAADKRANLINRVLASPQHVRRMTLLFDVVLMERLPDKGVKPEEWEKFLYDSFAANKPYDQLVRELLSADGADPALRPAAKFFLDRECEPNLLTRDIGRLFFGMDLQCAQCHDHPIVDDYFQADYYGLFAFVNRTSIFTDAKTKTTYVAEKADGEASFKSVFTGDSADRVTPRLPKGAAIVEPVLAKGAEYQVAPAKDVRPIPKFSRRAQLAAIASESDAFSRNIVNRLWAMMLGRGIVHPVEMHHIDNSPSHPELLSLLAAEFRASKYDIRAMLRQLASTRAYQQSCDLPKAEHWQIGTAAGLLTALQKQRDERAETAKTAAAALTHASAPLAEARQKNSKGAKELAALQAAVTVAKTASDKASAELAAAQANLTTKQEQAALVAEAAAKAQAAVAKISDDKLLAAAAAQIAERAKAIAGVSTTATQAVAEKTSAAKAASEQLAAAQAAVEKFSAGLPSAAQIASLEKAERDATGKVHEARYAVADLSARVEEAKQLVEYEQQIAKNDSAAAARVWNGLVDRWTARQQVTVLKPLTAEQFVLSMMQGLGVLAGPQAAAEAAIAKSPPDELKKAADADKPRIQAELVEKKMYDALKGNIKNFVDLYGSLPNEDFQATVNQALFFGNGTVVEGWLRPEGENLAARLAKITEPDSLADELYLSLFTRLPNMEERGDVAAFLKGRTDDRSIAIGEMMWAMISSSEFRFNH